jgi:hypothetical protein
MCMMSIASERSYVGRDAMIGVVECISACMRVYLDPRPFQNRISNLILFAPSRIHFSM